MTGLDPSGLLDMAWWSQQWDGGSWAQALTHTEEGTDEIRRATYTGRPLGSSEFVRRLETMLGRGSQRALVDVRRRLGATGRNCAWEPRSVQPSRRSSKRGTSRPSLDFAPPGFPSWISLDFPWISPPGFPSRWSPA